MNDKSLNIFIYLSSLSLAFSLSLPLTSLPLLGEVSYHLTAGQEAKFILIFCLSTPVFLFFEKSWLIILPLAGVWLTLLFPAATQLFRSDHGFFLQATEQADRITQEFSTDLFMSVADFSWGGYVFLVSLAVFSITAVMKVFK